MHVRHYKASAEGCGGLGLPCSLPLCLSAISLKSTAPPR
jgi:hypothetical protein